MKKKVIGAVVIVAALLGVLGFVKYNEYSAKEPVVKVELGDKISEKPEDYVKANKTALKKTDRKSTRLNSSHLRRSRMPSSA